MDPHHRPEHRAGIPANLAEPVVFLTAVQYTDCLSGRTRRLADELASRGGDVWFVEIPAVRAAARRFPNVSGVRREASGVKVLSIPPLPMFRRVHRTAVGSLWVSSTRRRLARSIPGLSGSTLVISTPWWAPVVRGVPRSVMVYDCLDHVTVHSGRRAELTFSRWERDLLGSADVSVFVSRKLRDAVGAVVPRARRGWVIPNGVNASWVGADADPIPREAMGAPPGKPVIGFLGAMFEWVDVELMASAAKLMPEAHFVAVGPQRRGVSVDALASRPNARVLPPVPFAEVPRWVSAFDVCMIPFKRNLVTELADPIKLYEYCAMGKSVVSSVPCDHPEVVPPVEVTDPTPEAFVAGLRRALASAHDGGRRSERVAFAREQTWERRADAIASAAAGARAR